MLSESVSSNPRNELFTVAVTLLWQLHDHAQDHDRTTLATDMLVAINELHNGPWRHLGRTVGRLQLPFTPACILIDQLLDDLQDCSPGLGPPVAIEAAREILNGNRPHGTSRSLS